MRGHMNVDNIMCHINQVEEQVRTPSQAYEDIEMLLSQLLTDKILASKVLEGFKMSAIKAYDGLSDPANHLRRYIAQIEIARANDSIMFKAFSFTPKGSMWFETL